MKYSEITPEIFVGPQYRRRALREFQRLGIDACINMRAEFDDRAHGLALKHYCYLPTIDDEAPSLRHLAEGVAFIKEVLSKDGKVYIHCAGGVGRAVTMAAAFFVATGASIDEALSLIKGGRPFIKVTPRQMEQLTLFARAIGQERQDGDRTPGAG